MTDDSTNNSVKVQVYPPTQPIKAIYAAVTSFLASLINVMIANDEAWPTALSWLIIILSTVIVTGGVYGLTNVPTKSPPLPVGSSIPPNPVNPPVGPTTTEPPL